MSKETLELAREIMDVLSQGDYDRLVTLADPEVEWISFFAELGAKDVYRGLDGMRRYGNDLTDAWEIVRADVDDAIAVGNVAVLVGRIHYRGKVSGIEDETSAGWMLKFRQGKVLRFRAFLKPEQALEAIGLSE